jgi:hypothetical protein
MGKIIAIAGDDRPSAGVMLGWAFVIITIALIAYGTLQPTRTS